MRCFGMMIDGRAQNTGIRQRGKEATMLIVLNGHHDAVNFTLPECSGSSEWSTLIDTNLPDEEGRKSFSSGEVYTVTPDLFCCSRWLRRIESECSRGLQPRSR